MLQVTWEWLGMAPALDLANTIAVEDGRERDLISSGEEYDRWAVREATFLPDASMQLLERARPELLDLRGAIRSLLAAVERGERPSARVMALLNGCSRRAPEWLELDGASRTLRHETTASRVERLLARYARSAMEVVAAEVSRLRRCPAPSCGMFYLSTRTAQRWCSTQCGTRARVARHYQRHRAIPP